MDRDRGYHLPPIYGTILQPRQNEAADVEEYFCPQANLLFSLHHARICHLIGVKYTNVVH